MGMVRSDFRGRKMINKIKQIILKYCLIIAGKIDEVKVKKSTIWMNMEIAISKLVPPDGQFHSYCIIVSYSAKVNANDDYRGYLMVDDIKVSQNGNTLSFQSEAKEDK